MADGVNSAESGRDSVAIFGGAFDPFHCGHTVAIRHLLSSDRVDRVVVVPSGDRPDKPNVSSARDRLEMTRRSIAECFAGDPRVEVSDLQVTGAVGYGTIDLVRHFKKDSSIEPLIVVGQELLTDLPSWKSAEELKESAIFLVLARPGGARVEPPSGWRTIFSKPFGPEGVRVSSTELRARLAHGERCEKLVTQGVFDYCRERGLYVKEVC